MGQKVWRAIQAVVAAAGDGMPEMLGVPVDDDRGKQVQPGHAEVLAFGGPVADFALAADTEGVFQSMMGLALVEADLGQSSGKQSPGLFADPPHTLHVGVEPPVDDEERPFHPPDFPQGHRQFMLARISRELPQELAWGHAPTRPWWRRCARCAHSDASGRSFRQHPVSHSGVSGHLRIVAA